MTVSTSKTANGQTATKPVRTGRERSTAIDSLRTAMMCVVMFGHPLLPYTTVPRRFQEPQAHVVFDVLGVFLYGFAMPAFFVTAGFAAAALYTKRGAVAFWRNRASRIFVPLLVGYVLLTPLTRAAYDFAQVIVATQSLQSGLEAISDGSWVRWGKAYHLWFLASLLVFSALMLLLLALFGRLPVGLREGLIQGGQRMILGRWRVVWLSGWVGLWMAQSYITGTGQGTSLGMQLAVFSFFALGWMFFALREQLPVLNTHWWRGIALGVAALPVVAWSTLDRLHSPEDGDVLMGLLAGVSNALLAVAITLGLIGLFQRHMAQRGPMGQYLSDASYWIYLIHYPIVIAAGGLLALTDWPALLKYVAVIALSLPLILGSYELMVRHGPLASLLGGRARQ